MPKSQNTKIFGNEETFGNKKMKRETFKNKVIANAYLLKNKFGENCKGHNRQLIATVLLLFFAIKTFLPKSQNTKIFGNEETFGNKKMKRETFKNKVIANAYLLKNKFGENCKGHNRQLIATVLLLFFAIKTFLPKSQNTKIFGNEETFGNKKMKRETFKNKVIANAYLLKNKFGENCKGHNRQLIATVLLLFFAIKTFLPKSQNTKIFGNEETFGNKKMKRETFKNKVIANAYLLKNKFGENCKGHNRQLIATVLPLFFCNKNSFAKISKHHK